MLSRRCPRCGHLLGDRQPIHLSCALSRSRHWLYAVTGLLLILLGVALAPRVPDWSRIVMQRYGSAVATFRESREEISAARRATEDAGLPRPSPTSIHPTPTASPTKQPSPSPTPTATPTANPTATQTASATSIATATAAATSTPIPTEPAPAGEVTAKNLNSRSGPGTEYPSIAVLPQGTVVTITGRNGRWWRAQLTEGQVGWVHSGYVEISGPTDNIPEVQAPPTPTPPPEPTQAPVPVTIATNRGDLRQGQDGWTYQYEQGRNSLNLTAFTNRRPYRGIDCYISPREDYVRLCRDGELHPGQQGRVAYRWDSTYDGPVSVNVHAHKVDTSCGDGVWVGTYMGEHGQPPYMLGEFTVGKADYRGTTKTYHDDMSRDNYLLVIVDIRRNATCDQSRVYIDILQR